MSYLSTCSSREQEEEIHSASVASHPHTRGDDRRETEKGEKPVSEWETKKQTGEFLGSVGRLLGENSEEEGGSRRLKK